MSIPLIVSQVGKFTVVEFRTPSLMDPVALEEAAARIYRLVDEEDRRCIILDFSRVEFLSSQALGIVMAMHKKLGSLSGSQFVVCGVGERLMQLVKIARLDRVLTIKPSQREAVNVVTI